MESTPKTIKITEQHHQEWKPDFTGLKAIYVDIESISNKGREVPLWKQKVEETNEKNRKERERERAN
ncbi:hypothetical protein RUM43_008508 [Polyplax serrata]|uniref:Uncharacterized protein n=1 Tax=Polyplax serrata TaxID=468196 RepID=A0AAN8S0K5_POLSC